MPSININGKEVMRGTKITWKELEEYLTNNHDDKGVIVFKQGKWFKKEFTEIERSYEVRGNCKWFDHTKLGKSIFGYCLDNDPEEQGVRLDHYMFYQEPAEKNWQVDYCYIVE